MNITNNLQTGYNNQYGSMDEKWRKLGAKQKFKNVLSVLKNRKIDNLLEVGCGDGSLLFELGNSGLFKSVYGLEISDSGIEKALNKNIPNLESIKKFDGYTSDYPDNYFDLVVCSHVIEHVEFPRALIREIKRISKNQLYEVPIDFSFKTSKKVNHFLSYGHINIYTPDLFRFLLKSEGHNIIDDKNTLYPYEIIKHTYRNNIKTLVLSVIKKFIFETLIVPKRIKPNAYTVFCEGSNKNLNIL